MKTHHNIKDIKIAFKKWCESSVHFRYNSNSISKTIHNSNWNEFKKHLNESNTPENPQPTIHINYCNNCPHVSHSGAFTPGGAKPICGNKLACSPRITKEKYHWKNRVLNTLPNGYLEIPKWCPIK